MVKTGRTRPSGSCYDRNNLDHWCQTVKQISIRASPELSGAIILAGGSDNGKFIYCLEVRGAVTYVTDSKFESGDIVLKIQEQKISGFTLLDAISLLKYCFNNLDLISIECVPCGKIPSNLAEYLSHRFQKGSQDHELQNTIRDNLYIRTVPVTTRKSRDSEVNGVDYVFLTVDEFSKLKLNGALLESGIYEGNYYGTPRPSSNSYISVSNENISNESKSICLLGLHPSSEGKRKRNRSNVEAMAGKNLSHDSIIGSQDHRKEEYGDNLPKKNPPSYYYDSNLKYVDQLEENELGPLPPKWEKAYTENGEVYFIDHNSSTSHWLDPRLSRIQKKSLEDCSEDELPYGWERIDDPLYGTYYIDHVNRQTQYENPVIQAKYGRGTSLNAYNNANNCSNIEKNESENYNHENAYNRYVNNSSKYNDVISGSTFFTTNPDDLVGERIHSTLVKSYKGLGFTIVGGDDSKDEFLQIKSIVTNGPAWFEGKLQTGDVLVYVNNKCVLGYTHNDMVSVFQSIAPGEIVKIEVCRGYALAYDPNDPNNEVVTTVAVGNTENAHLNSFVAQDAYLKRHHMMDIEGNDISGNSVKSMPDLYLPEKMHVPRPTSTDLILQDNEKSECLTMGIVKGSMGFGFTIADSAHGQKVKKILDKQRCQNLMESDILIEINHICVRKMCHSDVVQVLKDCPCNKAATITVERLHCSKNQSLNKDDLKMGLYHAKTPTEGLLMDSQNIPKMSEQRNVDIYSMENNARSCCSRSRSPGNELDQNDDSWTRKRSPEMFKNNENNYMPVSRSNNYYSTSEYSGHGSDIPDNYFYPLTNGTRKETTSFEHEQPASASNEARLYRRTQDADYFEAIITIERQEAGFGFRIVGGTEEGSQVSIGHIVEGGAAEVDGRLQSGDEIISVDHQSVINSSHQQVVQLMGKAATNGKVTLGIRRKLKFTDQGNVIRSDIRPDVRYPYDVTVTRRENEGFGFVIISSLNKVGSTIGQIIQGSPAERCGVLRIGDHILAVNGISIINLPHGDIVNLIKDSGYNVTLTIGMPLDDTSGNVSSLASHREDELYEGQYHGIEINRGSRGFGFSIRGGREFQNMALYVLQIAENGPAALDGRLKVGDRLIEINGMNTKNMTHAEAIEIIRNGGPSVRLLVQRGGKVPSLPTDDHFTYSPIQHHGMIMCSPSDSRSGMLNDRPESWDMPLSSS